MDSLNFPGAKNMRAPQGLERSCDELPVLKVKDTTWGILHLSYWQPTPAELNMLMYQGAVVRLTCCGSQVPVCMDVREKPEGAL